MLGSRRSTVFLTPPRDVLEVTPYAAANALSRERHGFGISKQSYMLRAKILEVDAIARNDGRFFEVHPEVAFRSLSAADLSPKKTYDGVRERYRALRSVGIELPSELGSAGRAPVDDVLDAAAVAWVGRRIASGAARSMPDPPDTDPAGLVMAIWV
jgi:predicted RNase H-like nuclease